MGQGVCRRRGNCTGTSGCALKGKSTEDGVANPTADRYLEDLANGNNAYEDPVRNGVQIFSSQALQVFSAGLSPRIN